MPNKDKDVLYTNKHLWETVIEECDIIAGLYDSTKCRPKLWVPNYDKVIEAYNQGRDASNMRNIMDYEFIKNAINKKNMPIYLENIIGDHKLPKEDKPCLITSSSVVDLFNVNYIPKLALIESHTGKLKNKTEWYTKYHKIGKQPMNMFPFHEELLFLLGDNHMRKLQPLPIRYELLAIAKSKNWTPRTTLEKVRSNIWTSSEITGVLKGFKRLYI